MIKAIARTVRHWVLPHSGNNFRAKLLHNSGIAFVLGIFLTFNLFVRILDSTPLHILGFTSSITIDDVVRLTNEQRTANGLPTLRYNDTLADAARRKAANMFQEDYWAHNSPSGKTPWYWFDQAGYKYTHAGENLAKDFGSADRMMSAWMNSPTHRDNIVSSKYQEIGVAVVPGTIEGKETMLVVQLFGSTQGGSVPAVSEVSTPQAEVAPETKGVQTQPETPQIAQIEEPVVENTPVLDSSLEQVPAQPLFDEFGLKKIVSLFITAVLMLVLIADMVIAESKSLSRRVGKNWAHLVFINVILILTVFVHAGRIL